MVPIDQQTAGLDYSVSFWWLFLGPLLLAFAQIIAYGCRLRAELDEVI